MNYAQVFMCDIANGPGCRTSLFVSGCTHHCKDCFNEILGGEPMEIVNQRALRPFMERIRRELPDKDIWIYSGYTYEELTDPNNRRCHCEATDAILAMTDVLVDGEFDREKKDITLKFRGSSNQRIIDIPATRQSGKVVLR